MKSNSLITILLAVIFLTNCGNNNAGTSNEQQSTNSSSQKSEETASTSAEGNDLVGEWEMVSSVVDTNDNLQIDEEERAKLQPVSFKDYMKLNRDGSGLFTIAKMEGRYEIKKDDSNGRNFMTWYDKANGPHRVGAVMKVTKDELTIKEPGGSGLFLWKRL